MVSSASGTLRQLHNSRRSIPATLISESESTLADRRRNDQIRNLWQNGIKSMILNQAGHDTPTGGAEEAARLTAYF